jgi:hypothetical protein
MFFPDRPAAYAEARRVLSPTGRLLFNTWDVVGRHDFQAAMTAALDRVFAVDPPTFLVAIPHGCADIDTVRAELRAGGFGSTTADTVTLEGHAASAADIATGYCTGTPLRAAIEARGDLAATTSAIAGEMEAQLGAGAVTGRMSAHVFKASPA